MSELTRDALFEALRKRHHYGTTGARIFLDVHGSFDQPVTGFSEDPKIARVTEFPVREALMGDIIRPGSVPMRLATEVIGTAPIERVDVLHGKEVVQTIRPYAAADLGRRVRVLWQGRNIAAGVGKPAGAENSHSRAITCRGLLPSIFSIPNAR